MSTVEARSTGVCLGCGCVCDDITLTVHDGQIDPTDNDCAVGLEWFRSYSGTRTALVDGTATASHHALAEAVARLQKLRRPLVYLAPDLSSEAQREAIALADQLRAVVDHPTSTCGLAGLLASQERGRAGATLGEVKNRADLIVFWGIDPARQYPRFQARYGAESVGESTPNGRASRQVVAVDIGDAHGPSDADVRHAVPPAAELPLLEQLRAAMETDVDTAPASPDGGALSSLAAELRGRLLNARYCVLVSGDGDTSAAPWGEGATERAHGLLALTQAANRITRCALVTLRMGGNISGAEYGLTSQSGYPVAVDFGRGFPNYRPYDGRAVDLIARREVDGILLAGAVGRAPRPVRDVLESVPTRVILGPGATQDPLSRSGIAIDGGLVGLDEPGTVYRMDDVPIHAPACLPARVGTLDLLLRLRRLLRVDGAGGRRP